MKVVLYILAVIVFFQSCVNSYRILIVLQEPVKSHFNVFKPLVRELARKNHNVTLVAHFSSGIEETENYREHLLENKHDLAAYFSKIREEGNVKLDRWGSVSRFAKASLIFCDDDLSDKAIVDLRNSREEYDLIILEHFCNDCFLGVAGVFNAPVIGISSTALLTWHNDRFGNIDNPSYIPNPLYLFSNRMNFWERCENFLVTMYTKLYYNMITSNNDIRFAEKYFGEKIDSMSEFAAKRTSLIFVNTHFTLSFPRPLVPNVVEIGGIHLPENQRLPQNIEKFINESKHGVIYFSLGSMIKGHTFPQEKKDAFLKAFARLPQRVLWKWENETMPGKPDNVMIQKWMPQFDILSHPNVKAFISHGGLLGTTEAVHCGVPMMVMPQYGDQYTNAKAVEANGGGVILYLKDATEEKVYNNLKTILDPEFRAKAKALSERFRDRPMSPMDTAIYWVEYVARHKGAPHMKTAAVDMPLYQYLLLDVLAFLGLILLVFSYISYKILSLVLRSVFSKKKVKQN
ncbi:UDP-glycosyltransferase UGT5-like isoform X1 [Harmonia axyridis]|uniref:UDP-glycosyltransferase UGT5-like isoform X1 n=1 Tax=Harmonia axyridis TaxID=115357 RepID=UPI001E2755EA|nr:UDP-glycosyltransferase UGT5-like isoform X1 [Harmonia axyridis]